MRVAKTKWKQAVLASINVGNPPRAIGVCHPYGASPLVRRAIPELLDGRPIGIHPRDGFQVKRADVTYPILTIEAPLAGCFELVATGNLRLPARVVLLFSTASLAFELAIVRVSAQRDVLNLDVRQVRNFSDPPDTKAVSQLLSGCIPINTPAETCYLYRIGENPTLREIERTLRQDFSALQFIEEPKEEPWRLAPRGLPHGGTKASSMARRTALSRCSISARFRPASCAPTNAESAFGTSYLKRASGCRQL